MKTVSYPSKYFDLVHVLTLTRNSGDQFYTNSSGRCVRK